MKLHSFTNSQPPSTDFAEKWNRYVMEENPNGTIFHSLYWNEVLSRSFGLPYFLFAVEGEDGKIQGNLILQKAKGLSGKAGLYSTPYTVYGGILASDTAAEKMLADAAAKLGVQENVEYVALRNPVPNQLDLPGIDIHVNFVKKIEEEEDKNLLGVPRKSRATIRHSINKYKLEYEINRDWELLWELHAINLKKLGTPVFPKKYFKNIMDVLGDKVNILFVKDKGKPVCGVMTFYFHKVCNPYFSGSLPESNYSGANNYMYYALMCDAGKKGYKYFDFGKSRVGTGSYNFKRNMGFEPKVLPYQFILNKATEVPNINPSNPKYALFIKYWSMQPLWTSKIIGPILNKFFP